MNKIDPLKDSVQDLKPRGKKVPMSLLPYRPLRAIVAAFHDGATKYAKDNWRNQGGTDDWRETYTDALQRHVNAFADPDYPDVADDSGVHHLAHAGACAIILLYHLGADYVIPNSLKKKEQNQ